MKSTYSGSAYPSFIILLHWLMLAMIAAAYALMELKSFAPRGSEARTNMALLHYLIGLTVFSLTWLRLTLRMAANIPPIMPAPTAVQARIARLVHALLYAIMVALPLMGWLALSANGRPVHLYLFDLPFPIGSDKALARQLKELHQLGANAGYFVIGLHAAVALFHHHVKHDNTLRRMLPSRFRG